MKIAVIPNLIKAEAKLYADEVVRILHKYHCETYLKRDLFDRDGIYREAMDPELSHCDLFIAVGGDGTIIHTAKLAALMEKPILGVNAGKLGFTAGIEPGDLERLSCLLEWNYRIEKRAMLSVRLTSEAGGSQKLLAMNDAVVSSSISKIIDYEIAFGQHTAYPYRADGFIVATPTGSTAYSLSAGGPIIQPDMDCLEYTPICPHSLFGRSILFSSNTQLRVNILGNVGTLQLSVDGETPVHINPGDYLTFAQSSRVAQFIRLDNCDFYEILNQKIIEGRQ